MDIPKDVPNQTLFMELVSGLNDKWIPFGLNQNTPSKKVPFVSDSIKKHSLKRLTAMRTKKHDLNADEVKNKVRRFSQRFKALYGRTAPRAPMQQFGVMVQDTVEFCLQNIYHPDIDAMLAAVPAAKQIYTLLKKPAIRGEQSSPTLAQCTLESKKFRTIIDFAWVSVRDTKACVNLFELKVSLNAIAPPSKIYPSPASLGEITPIMDNEDEIDLFWIILAFVQMAPGMRAAYDFISAKQIDARITAGVIYAVPGSEPKYFVVNRVTAAWISELEKFLV